MHVVLHRRRQECSSLHEKPTQYCCLVPARHGLQISGAACRMASVPPRPPCSDPRGAIAGVAFRG